MQGVAKTIPSQVDVTMKYNTDIDGMVLRGYSRTADHGRGCLGTVETCWCAGAHKMTGLELVKTKGRSMGME